MNYLVKIENNDGNLVVSSRVIAKELEKEHKHILETIDKIIKNNSAEISAQFIKSEYKDSSGKKNREYLLKRDGFILYICNIQGYNDFKMSYINKFNEMEQLIRNRSNSEWLLTREQGKLIRRQETDVIQLLIFYAKEQGSKNYNKLYMTYSKLVNSLVGVKSNSRDTIPYVKLMTIHQLEDMFSKIILECMKNKIYYKEIYLTCKKRGSQLMALLNNDVKALEFVS